MLYIVPSRSRPHNIVELIHAWEETRHVAHLWVCVDVDDPHLAEYKEISSQDTHHWVKFWVGPRLRLGPTLNYYSRMGVIDHTIIGFMGDDHRPRTSGWDGLISHAIHSAGGTAMAYANDLIQGPNLATAVAMSSDIIKTLGYMVPMGMKHLYLDNAWMEMGKEVGNLIYRKEIVIEHCHPIAGKAEWDDLYREVNSGTQYEEDSRGYQRWLENPKWRQRLHALRDGVTA